MQINSMILTATVLLSLGMRTAIAESFSPKTDNQVAALELRTGKMIWTFKPKKLSDAHFEVHPQGLVVFPHYAHNERTDAIFLDLARGKPIEPFQPVADKCLARSAAFWPLPRLKLDNGWELVGFSPGNTKSLRFSGRRSVPDAAPKVPKPKVLDPKAADPKKSDPKQAQRTALVNNIWTISTGGFPHAVTSWKNTVMYAFSYLSKEGVIYAYRSGDDKPRWTIDLNSIVRDRPQPLTRMRLQVISDTLYVEANEHIFAFAPDSGKLIWHRDLCADLDLHFRPDLFGGALNLAVFAEAKDVLIVSFERRVIAYDLQHGKYLWHFEPDTFPHCPFPALHDGKVYLTCGANHRLHQLEK